MYIGGIIYMYIYIYKLTGYTKYMYIGGISNIDFLQHPYQYVDSGILHTNRYITGHIFR